VAQGFPENQACQVPDSACQVPDLKTWFLASPRLLDNKSCQVPDFWSFSDNFLSWVLLRWLDPEHPTFECLTEPKVAGLARFVFNQSLGLLVL
jgi:hypothetical protein